MAQYKVPQDVEADDKLLGPFSFRQFVYLLIAGGLIALAVGLFQLFPLLAIIPIPFIILFAALALPLKKDQPMETYLAALVSYYLKPHTRMWIPGQRDSVIKITAPKIVEDSKARDLSGEEANHRLSFLADIVDTGGQAIKGGGNGFMREDLVAEASMATDMFEGYKFDNLNSVIQKDETERHEEVVRGMHEAIAEDNGRFTTVAPMGYGVVQQQKEASLKDGLWNISEGKYDSEVVVKPDLAMDKDGNILQGNAKNSETKTPKPSIIELANNSDYSVETIAKEAKRINEREGEVFISLH